MAHKEIGDIGTFGESVEQHPYHHDFYRCTDYVLDKNCRGRVIEVKRVEECKFCPTKRITIIDTNVWERKRKPYYKYDKGFTIKRVSARTFLMNNFLSTTNLSTDLFGV
jgi:hypothetical protein